MKCQANQHLYDTYADSLDEALSITLLLFISCLFFISHLPQSPKYGLLDDIFFLFYTKYCNVNIDHLTSAATIAGFNKELRK